MTRFYILIHFVQPEFLLNDENSLDPASWSSEKEAHALAAHHTTCARVGYTVIGWDAEQGGDGIVSKSEGIPVL